MFPHNPARFVFAPGETGERERRGEDSWQKEERPAAWLILKGMEVAGSHFEAALKAGRCSYVWSGA